MVDETEKLRGILARNYNPREALELGLSSGDQLDAARFGLSFQEYVTARKMGISPGAWAMRRAEVAIQNGDEAQAIEQHRMLGGMANAAAGIGDASARIRRALDESERK